MDEDCGAMTDFSFATDELALPPGAIAKTHRWWLRYRGKAVFAITGGPYRSYIYPLFSPSGYSVTSEAPADHPHHNSVWLGADHVHAMMATKSGAFEEYTYNFYVNEVFQGRAPGRIVETGCRGRELSPGTFEISQTLDWRGPSEWGAAHGRLLITEVRIISVVVEEHCYRFTIDSAITPVSGDIQIGPTRHAFFNVRVAESMTVANGGCISGHKGNLANKSEAFLTSRWIDFTGPVGGGAKAGITVVPHPIDGFEHSWFVADWGVVTVGPFRDKGITLQKDVPFRSSYTLLVHDGDFDREQPESVHLAG